MSQTETLTEEQVQKLKLIQEKVTEIVQKIDTKFVCPIARSMNPQPVVQKVAVGK